MMWWWNDYSASMHWLFGPLMMIVVVALIFFMMRGMMGGQRSNDRLALDILNPSSTVCAWVGDITH
jgi:hypothetical protein